MTAAFWRQVVEVARTAASAGSPDEIAATMLPAVARAFDSPLVAWYRVEPNGLSGRVAPGMPDPFPSYSGVAAADPYQEIKRRLNPRVAVVSDLVDSSAWRRSSVLNEYYPTFEAARHLVARVNDVPFGQPGVCAMVLCRSARQPGWGSADVELLEQLLPVVREAARRTWEGRWAQQMADILGGVLGHNDCGAIAVFDAEARLVWMSPKARGLLVGHLGKRWVLPDPFLLAVRRVGMLAGERIPRSIALDVGPLDGGSLRASLRLSRLPDESRWFVVAQFEAAVATAADVADRFGLTRAELAVACELLGGRSNPEIGRRLFVSRDTVRTHLRHIFQKLGVSSRVEAILKLRA
jgi:DNA-binding CsgD family transcriptional regulator